MHNFLNKYLIVKVLYKIIQNFYVRYFIYIFLEDFRNIINRDNEYKIRYLA